MGGGGGGGGVKEIPCTRHVVLKYIGLYRNADIYSPDKTYPRARTSKWDAFIMIFTHAKECYECKESYAGRPIRSNSLKHRDKPKVIIYIPSFKEWSPKSK